MKGPAIFLAQFAGTAPSFDKLETMAQWAASLGYVGVQVPTDPKRFDLERAALRRIKAFHVKDGAREGAPFIRAHMIRTTAKAFDDFAASGADAKAHVRILGLEQ